MRLNKAQSLPINIVGSSTFGRYPKISAEKTVNMFISDGWLINYAGYNQVSPILSSGTGRGLFRSLRYGILLLVVDNLVYYINVDDEDLLNPVLIVGQLTTSVGEVYMDENNNGQICIVDGEHAYIYYHDTRTLTKSTEVDFPPGYVKFLNTFFLIAPSSTAGSAYSKSWKVYVQNGNNEIKLNTVGFSFEIQNGADKVLAVIPVPGKSNTVLVLGEGVGELWTNVGGQDNFQKITSVSIDYGCASVDTIAYGGEFICWLGVNRNSEPAILYTNGGQTKQIATDGIDYLMQTIQFPADSTAFFTRQDGHLFYQITFYNKADNLTFVYDFVTEKFFNLEDENGDYYPARQVAYYNQQSYFISLKDAAVYQMATEITHYNYDYTDQTTGYTIPRSRITRTIRNEDSLPFRVGIVSFWIEQGVNDFPALNLDQEICDGQLITEDAAFDIITEDGYTILSQTGVCYINNQLPCVDLQISINGNQSYSRTVRRYLNTESNFRNIIQWNQLGSANEMTFRFAFWGLQRFVVHDGYTGIY